MHFSRIIPAALLICLFLLNFSCKKSVPEVKEEEQKQEQKKEEVKEEPVKETPKVTETVRRITDEQFAEAEELITRAKSGMADVYDPANLNGAIDALKKSRDLNETNPQEAFVQLDASRKMSQDAYYNSFKKRSLEKKEEAERLMAELEANGGSQLYKEEFTRGVGQYTQGNTSFEDENFTASLTEYSESVAILSSIKATHDAYRAEYETRIKYVQELVKQAEKIGAKNFAQEEFVLAQESLIKGIELYRKPDPEGSSREIQIAEDNALKAIAITEKALKEQKRLEALGRIKKAGKAVENAAGKEILSDDGKAQKGLEYKFEIEEEGKADSSNAPDDDSISYKDVLTKAVEYIEKAKEAYYREEYEMAIRYAEIAERIALSYNAGGIKTQYTVRLIPENRDCLWRIAEYDFIYGNPFYWPMIWKSNKEKILNPDLIFPGQIFAIPELD